MAAWMTRPSGKWNDNDFDVLANGPPLEGGRVHSNAESGNTNTTAQHTPVVPPEPPQ